MMFKEFMASVVSLAFFCVVSDMLMREGVMKKYLSLTFGFMMICTLIVPITTVIDPEPFEFSFDGGMSNEEISAKSEAYILKLHEENIRAYIMEFFGEGTEAFVELYSDGAVKSVVIFTSDKDALKLEKLKETLGCKNIKFGAEMDYDI